MNHGTKLSIARCSAVVAVAVLAQGCASQSAQLPEPQPPELRQTSQTAPADLQLACAAEAARVYQVASERVLPISSSSQGSTYTVVLNADGAEAVCTIDEEGTVLSLVRA
jgi:hypothetical protein